MKIFLKTSGSVLIFFLAVSLGFAFWLVPRLSQELSHWDDDAERNSATVLAEALTNDMKTGQHAEVAATLSRVWANRPDWALIEAYDAQGQRIYPTNAISAPNGLQKVSVRITGAKERLGALVIYFDGSLRSGAVRHATRDFEAAVLIIGVGMVALSLLLHWLYVTRPIRALRKNLTHVDAPANIPPQTTFTNDEIGELSRSFEKFRQELVRREQALTAARQLAEEDSRTNVSLRMAAEEANKAKSNFISMVSHELRTPMNGIMGMASVIANGPLDEALRQKIRTIEESSEHLLAIINQILDFSSAESGKERLEEEAFDLHELVAAAFRIIESVPAARLLTVAYRMAEDVPRRLRGDARRIKQVLLNLLGNAVKFTPSGSVTLDVSASVEGPDQVRLCLAVTDTGPGISAAMQQRIFEPFVKLSGFSGGTGLGLSICQRYALLMGGTLTMHSTEGEGATFTFCVPLQTVQWHPAQEQVRLQALANLTIMDTDPEAAYDELVAGAARVCGTPIALISLVDDKRQWFKARVGLAAGETPREQAFCAHAIQTPTHTMVVPDATTDPRFASNPLVTGESNFRFYAGVPLTDATGQALGTLCVIDTQPRELSPQQLSALEALAQHASRLLQNRSRSALRVLVAEDTPTSALVVRLMLADLGHTVRVVEDGQQAVQALREEAFDLVLMDIQMPVLDGLAATQTIREPGQPWGALPIVGCSAFASELDRQNAIDSGMTDYLIKPIKRKDFQALLARLSVSSPPDSPPAPP